MGLFYPACHRGIQPQTPLWKSLTIFSMAQRICLAENWCRSRFFRHAARLFDILVLYYSAVSWQNTFFSKTAFRENRDLVFWAIKWRQDLVIRQILCERYLDGIYCLHTKFCVKIWFYMGFRTKNVFCRITMKKMCWATVHFFLSWADRTHFFSRRLKKMSFVGSRWKTFFQ